MTILALDIGKRRIGVAVSDQLGITAQALPTILYKDDKTTFERLREIVGEKEVTKIVVGLPKNLDGTLGPQARYVLGFVEKIKKEFPLEILTWDERFSSQGSERVLLEGGVKRLKRKSKLDQLSAQWILQGYLESLRNA